MGDLSPVGAFCVGFFLGFGIILILYAFKTKDLNARIIQLERDVDGKRRSLLFLKEKSRLLQKQLDQTEPNAQLQS